MSATGNPRNKVALKPGHSLMDWIRLGKSGEDLTGTNGAVLQVTKEQLAKHSTENDAWICLRGNVYNVTRYKNFHPGGVEELMKGAGIDATSIFNKVHPWVNFESILRQCYVGKLKTNMVEEDVFGLAGPSQKTLKPTENSVYKAPLPKLENETKLDWYQQQNFITLVIYNKEFPQKFHLHGEEIDDLKICLNDISMVWHFPHSIIWPPLLTVMESKIEAKFTKEKAMTWSDLPKKVEDDTKDNNTYWPMIIKQIDKINHNVFLISLLNSKRTLAHVPIGYHVPVKASINGENEVSVQFLNSKCKKVKLYQCSQNDIIKMVSSCGSQLILQSNTSLFVFTTLDIEDNFIEPVPDTNQYIAVFPNPGQTTYTNRRNLRTEIKILQGTSVERNYTPVCGLTSKLQNDVNIIVKSYPDGIFSSWLTSRKVGEVVMVGNPVGFFSTKHISKATQIVLIAAGTGFTPMARIIDWGLARRNKVAEVKLIFFNKSEKDIIWRTEIDKLLGSNKRFKVVHVLSEADSSWKNSHGWVTPQLLQGYIPDYSKENPLKYFVCVCGPIAFTQLTERYLQDMGYNQENYFCFRG